MDLAQIELILTAHTDDGASARALARSVATGRLVRLRNGVHVESAVWAQADVGTRTLLRMRALQAVSTRRPVFSHWSAATALGLPVPDARLAMLDVTSRDGSRANLLGVRVHAHPLDASDIIEVNGLLVTDWARTVIDLAAAASFREAVAAADAALHRLEVRQRAIGDDALLAAVERGGARKAFRRIAEVVEFADGASESVAESYSRCTIRVLRLPAPNLQFVVTDGRGFAARLDLCWPELKVAGEVDGLLKYTNPYHGDAARAVYEEKRREDRVRAAGFQVVRWGCARRTARRSSASCSRRRASARDPRPRARAPPPSVREVDFCARNGAHTRPFDARTGAGCGSARTVVQMTHTPAPVREVDFRARNGAHRSPFDARMGAKRRGGG